MNKYFLIALFVLCSFPANGSGKFKLDDFSIRLEQVTSTPSHIWVSGGYTTVNPRYHTVTGVNEFFSPPYAAKDFGLKVNLKLDSISIPDNGSYGKGDVGLLYSGGVWFPHKIVRYGTYHHWKGHRLVSLGVTTELIPLTGQAGFMEKITVKNRASTPVELEMLPELHPGIPDVVPLGQWGYSPPQSKASQAQPSATGRWANEAVNVGMYCDHISGKLLPGQSLTAAVTVIITRKDTPLPGNVHAGTLEQESVDAWQKRLDTYTKNIPALTGDITGLNDYYKRSLISGLVCIWENPAYTMNPFFATSGIDGGGICTYLWDNAGYTPQITSMMLGSKVIDLAKKMAAIDLERFYAFAPDGSGLGVKYSYSPVAFTGLVSAIFKFIAPDKDLFNYNKTLILNNEKRKSANNLIDYGFQHNLLEMRGTGWEHFVVSPNAERSWCLNQLAEMGKWAGAGKAEMEDWKQQADRVITSVRKELWDPDRQWFASVYPDGYRDYVHSIQIYDALRAGVCTPAMEKVLIAELKEGAYLGSHGVSSISKTDSTHFEVLDTDWSGGGAYTGDGPQLALDMFEKGYPEIGWDILQRHFWMGKQLIYFPQEHFCDRPMSPPHKRANVASGLIGAETILFGLVGFRPQYNGELYIHPQLVVDGTIQLNGFVFRNHSIDVNLSSKKMVVRCDGKPVYEGEPQLVKIL